MTSSNSPKENQLGSTQQLRHPFISIVGAVRLLNVLFPVTSFVPDEYWQALEVAHRLVFGYPLHGWMGGEKEGSSYLGVFSGLVQ